MSRIGRLPVNLPKGVEVGINGCEVSVKGPKGSLTRVFCPEVKITKVNDTLVCSVDDLTEKRVKSLFGLTRSLLANMVLGVTTGFSRELEVVGIGYKVKADGPNKVTFTVGYSHSVTFETPKEVVMKVEGQKVTVSGVDKQLVGQMAADIRGIKPPEPYKGTGIKYSDEVVRIKEGKKVAA